MFVFRPKTLSVASKTLLGSQRNARFSNFKSIQTTTTTNKNNFKENGLKKTTMNEKTISDLMTTFDKKQHNKNELILISNTSHSNTTTTKSKSTMFNGSSLLIVGGIGLSITTLFLLNAKDGNDEKEAESEFDIHAASPPPTSTTKPKKTEAASSVHTSDLGLWWQLIRPQAHLFVCLFSLLFYFGNWESVK